MNWTIADNVRSDRQFATGKVGRHRVESAPRDCGRETALSHQSLSFAPSLRSVAPPPFIDAR